MNRRVFLMVTTAIMTLIRSVVKAAPVEVPVKVIPVEVPVAVPKIEGADLPWGTYGIGPFSSHSSHVKTLRWVKLGDCESGHLQNILRTESWHIPEEYDQAIRRILQSRGVEPLHRNQCGCTL